MSSNTTAKTGACNNRRRRPRGGWSSSAASLTTSFVLSSLIVPTHAQPGWGWEAQCIGQWLQCGGLNYWGPTNCCDGHQCEYVNDWWWQCNPVENAPQPTPAPTAVEPAPTIAPTHKPHHWGHHHNHSHVPTSAPTPFPTASGPPFWEQECFRVRKNILSLNPDELATFIEAFQTLKDMDIYDNITAIHGNQKTFNLFHGNDYFLPWHRWYVMFIETAVRNLGGKFACFSMPYWDWTLDAGKEALSPVFNFFGPMGKANESFCMRTGPWANWLNSKGGCLKRIGSDSYRFFSPAEVLDLIMTKDKYVNSFRPAFEAGAHSRPHLYLGGAMNTFASPDDPIFWLHHTMVDKVWTMWQDCHHMFDPTNIPPEMFKPELVDVDLAYAPGITTRTVWSVKNLGYTYQTDIMSASTFTGMCHWYNLAPDPTLSTIPIPGSIEDPNAPPPPNPTQAPPPLSKDSTPNLRGKAQEEVVVATEESAAIAAAAASLEPHGKGLIVEETRVYGECLARVAAAAAAAAAAASIDDDQEAAGGEPTSCLKEVLARDCEMLGYICDLPASYRDGMNLAEGEAILKMDNSCARSCEAQVEGVASEEGGDR